MTLRAAAALLLLAVLPACNTRGRSVRTWIEVHDPAGRTVPGAAVVIDGRPLGITDHRGMFRVKIRRHVGSPVAVRVVDEGEPAQFLEFSFTVGTNGGPAGLASDRLVVTLSPGRPSSGFGAAPSP